MERTFTTNEVLSICNVPDPKQLRKWKGLKLRPTSSKGKPLVWSREAVEEIREKAKSLGYNVKEIL